MMDSVQETIATLNVNFQRLQFEDNPKFFSDILPDQINEITNFIIRVHDKFHLPQGIENVIEKTIVEQEIIKELIIGKDLNYWQKDYLLHTCKIKITECLQQFHNDCYYPGILSSII